MCRLVIIDSAQSWAKELAEEGVISKFIDIDFSDEGAVFDKCREAINKVEQVPISLTCSLKRRGS